MRISRSALFWAFMLHFSLRSAAEASVMDYFKPRKLSPSPPSHYEHANPRNPQDYGVDVSFPIHSFDKLDPHSLPGQRYKQSMDSCAARYSQSECMSTERARVNMNRNQPATQHNYTKVGFKKLKLPESVFSVINTFYQNNKDKPHLENWPRGNTYTNHWDSPTKMISTEDGKLRGAGNALKTSIWNGVKPILEEWSGHKLRPTSLYGIRLYYNGAILATHVDRLPLVTSCIINVDQDLNEPWPIEVYDHDGRAHNVTMEPGDMVLYESHTVLHGRPAPLNGSFYANLFVHFEPIDHAAMNDLDAEEHSHPLKTSATASQRKEGGHEANNHNEAELAFHRDEIKREQEQPLEHLPLNDAAAIGDLVAVQELVRTVPKSINTKDRNGWQPIHEAVRGGHLEVVKFLVDNGSDIGLETNGGGSPLWWARRTLDPGHSVIMYLEEIGAPDRLDE